MNKKIEILMALIFLSVIIGTVIAYFYMPEEIPTHWNAKGEIDEYTNKTSALWILAIGAIAGPAIYYLMNVFRKVDPKAKNYEKFNKTYNIIKYLITFTMIAFHILFVYVAFNEKVDMVLIICLMMAILFIVMGNYMPRIKQNFFMGLKTPWTLSSEKSWRKTHQLGGILFIIAGIILVIFVFIDSTIALIALTIYITIAVIIMFVYSYLVYKNDPDKKEKENRNK